MIKKIISSILAICVVGSISITSYAYDTYVSEPICMYSDEGIMPLYDNVNYVTSGISINSKNKAVCTGAYMLYSKEKSIITMTLMKSSNGVSNWTAVESWSQTNTVQNPGGISRTSTNTLSSSYYYCNFVQVQILDSNDNVIETVGCFSNPCHL